MHSLSHSIARGVGSFFVHHDGFRCCLSKPVFAYRSVTIGWKTSSTTSYLGVVTNRHYSSPSSQNVADLCSILGDKIGSIVTSDDDVDPLLLTQETNNSSTITKSSIMLDGYNTDWRNQYKGQSRLVLKPHSVEQVSQILQYCHDRRLPVVPQGGKTGLVGGSVPVKDEIILSLERLDQVYHVDAVTGILYCQAGCILSDLQDEASRHNLLVPVDLGSKGTCQIGGNLSTNAGGQYYYRYGSLAANLVGMQVVLPNALGQVLNLNFAVTKNNDYDETTTIKAVHSNLKDNSGYKLHQLMLGSEGTLGVVTAVALKCAPLPRSKNAAFLACQSFDQVFKLMQLAKQELGEILAALEWMDQAVLRVIQQYSKMIKLPVTMNDSTPYPHAVLIETHGSCENHDAEKMHQLLEKAMAPQGEGAGPLVVDGVLAQDLSQLEAFWKVREMANPSVASLGYGYKYDLSLPVADFDKFGREIQEHVLQHQCSSTLLCTNWGHVLDGNLHLNFSTPGDYQWNEDVIRCLEPFVFEQVLKLGGSISAEHGIGRSKRKELLRVHDLATLNVMRAVKQVFDPAGILNPHKVLP